MVQPADEGVVDGVADGSVGVAVGSVGVGVGAVAAGENRACRQAVGKGHLLIAYPPTRVY